MRILINRTDAIGDTILSLPIASLIKEKYPNACIAFLVAPISYDLFISHPMVDEVYILNKNKTIRDKLKDIKKTFNTFEPDHYLYLGGTHLVSLFALLKGVSFRGGLVSKALSFLFLNKGVRQKRSLALMHESDYNLKLLKPLGIDYQIEKRSSYAPIIKLSPSECDEALSVFQDDLKKKGITHILPMIFIHPGMTGHTLNWSSQRYAELIKKMDSLHPDKYQYIISYTPSDESFLKGLRDFLNQQDNTELLSKIYFFDGSKRGLRNYMNILSFAKLFIGPSTGTLHIANTLNISCIGIYSPIKVQSSLRWGPFNQEDKKNVIIVEPLVHCQEQSQCALKRCPYYECMDKIEVNNIVNQMIPLLENVCP